MKQCKNGLGIVLLLVLGMLLLVGCQDKKTEGNDVAIVTGGASDYVIVRSDGGDENDKEAAKNLRTAIYEKTGAALRLTTDYVKDPQNIESERNTLEILIGQTNRPGTNELVEELNGMRYEFIIRMVDAKHLMILGYTSEGTLLGVNYFIEQYLSKEGADLIVKDTLDVFGKYDYPIKKLTIEGNAISDYRICISAAASRAVKNAANDLQAYLWNATGTRLTIVTDQEEPTSKEIIIGETTRSQNLSVEGLGVEDYRIVTDGDVLLITGGADRGIMYGVYGLLQDYLGWNFYTPTIEDCDHNEKINLASLDVTVVPYFYWRELYTFSAIDAKWCVKNGINGNIIRDIGDNYGGSIAWVGSQGHNLGELAGTGSQVNPCLTDDTIYQTVLRNVKALLSRSPDAAIISISQLDAATYCQCSNCKQFMREHGNTYSSLILNLVNRVAEALEAEYPDLKIETLAYLETLAPPKNMTVHKNVIVRFCPITAVRSDAMNDTESMVNLGFCAQLNQWKSICSEVFVWDYTCAFQQQFLPISNYFDLRESVAYYYEAGVAGLMMQGFPREYSPEFGELRSFLLARCMRNPHMSEEEYVSLVKKFLRAYYGDGWENIYDYLVFLEDCTGELHIPYNPTALDSLDIEKFLSAIDTYRAKWDEAEALTSDDEIKENISRSRMQFTYLVLELTYERDYQKGSAETKSAYTTMAKEFFEEAKGYNMWFRENMKLPTAPDFTKPPSQWQ